MNNFINGNIPSNGVDHDDGGYMIGNDIIPTSTSTATTTTTTIDLQNSMNEMDYQQQQQGQGQQYDDGTGTFSSFPLMLDEGSLDHAILESLFYNEMAFLNSGSCSVSSNNSASMNDTIGDGSIPSSATDATDSFLYLPTVPPPNGGYNTSSMVNTADDNITNTAVNDGGLSSNDAYSMFQTNTYSTDDHHQQQQQHQNQHVSNGMTAVTDPYNNYQTSIHNNTNYSQPQQYTPPPQMLQQQNTTDVSGIVPVSDGIQNSPYPLVQNVNPSMMKSNVASSLPNHLQPQVPVRTVSTTTTTSPFQRKPAAQISKQTLAVVSGGGIRHNVVPVLDKNDSERTEYPPASSSSIQSEKNNTSNKITLNENIGTTESIPPQQQVTNSISDDKKRKKLIAQFATLAGRLGITLPPQVLQKLTDKAVVADAATLSTMLLTSSSSVQNPIVEADATSLSIDVVQSLKPVKVSSFSDVNTNVSNEPQPPPPSVAAAPVQPIILQQVRKSAEEAIAAVDNKRSNSSAALSSLGDSATNSNNGTMVDSGGNKPYSKKRKKPRLSDCEQKLAELQSENMILKQHLANIANKNARLDDDRMKAETQMRQMLQDNAPDNVLDPIVKNFTEMYSDYGRKRHDELNFHLQQLQRLANPTNFTKMGLWTLGGGAQTQTATSISGNNGSNKANMSSPRNNNSGGSKNPIAGMLQRELGISTQQGRKILEQRQKIQKVCSNLKECLKLLAKLNQLCEKKTQIFHNRMTKCQEVLTPKQVVKLLIWIDDNSHTLGSVCPGWGSEQFQSKATVTKKDSSGTS